MLYISANQSVCPPVPPTGPTTLAFASHCQLEDTMDRPVAGNVNFCPEGIARNVNGLQYISAVTKHELLHALGFSSSLFPFWHDSSGSPRTAREGNRVPTVAGTSTVRTLTYTRWQTRNGVVRHNVMALVTPAVRVNLCVCVFVCVHFALVCLLAVFCFRLPPKGILDVTLCWVWSSKTKEGVVLQWTTGKSGFLE